MNTKTNNQLTELEIEYLLNIAQAPEEFMGVDGEWHTIDFSTDKCISDLSNVDDSELPF